MMGLALALALSSFSANGQAETETDFRGNVSLQGRAFLSEPLFPNQEDYNLSVAAQPEWNWQWNDRRDSFTLELFGRWDQNDGERTHADIRQAAWIHVGEEIETRVGLRRVFWGVTEFQHLVDIINQSDLVEDLDAEDKLGQPMINFSTVQDWGIVDLYILPYFRERTFAGADGRPRLPLPVFVDDPLYESDDEEKHIDYALRWSNTIDVFDVGVAYFDGTARDPSLLPAFINGELGLRPYYPQIERFSVDAQATIESWLWKLEAIHQHRDGESFVAMHGGFEYTIVGFMESAADLGLLIEYGWDERDEQSTSLFQNDLLFGARLAMNDMASSELLMGISRDLDYDSHSLLVEGSRRFGQNLVVSIDLRLFDSDEPEDVLYGLRRDDYLQVDLEYYF